jgi:hypothetical protein
MSCIYLHGYLSTLHKFRYYLTMTKFITLTCSIQFYSKLEQLRERNHSWIICIGHISFVEGSKPDSVLRFVVFMAVTMEIKPNPTRSMTLCIFVDKGKGAPYKRPLRPRGWVEVQPYPFMTSALRWEWVVSTTPRPLNPRERPGTHCTGGWVGPRARPGFDPRTAQPVASHYTDWAIPTRDKIMSV